MNKNLKNIFLIFIVSFNLRLGISSVPPLLAMIKSTLHITNFEASLLTSVPVICMGIFAFFINKFQQYFGRRMGILCLLLLLGLATLSRVLVQSYIGLLSTAFLIGFSVAITGPLLSGFIKEEFPNRSGLLIGIYSLGMGLGSVCASGTVAWLSDVLTGNWSLTLALWGLPALLTGLMWFFYAPTENKQKIANQKSNHFSILKNEAIWYMFLFFGLQSGLFYGLITWITEFFRHKQLSQANSILLLTIFTAVQMICSFVIPVLMDSFGKTSSWIAFCSFCTAIGALLLLLFPPQSIALISILFFAIGTGGFFPLAMLFPLAFTTTPDEASRWTGMTQSFGYILGGLLPIIMGVIIDLTESYNSLIYQLLVGSLLLAYIGIQLARKTEMTARD